MSDLDLTGMRLDYETADLDEASFADDPISQFEEWFQAALDADVYEPNAMVVGTVDADGQPWTRFVLLKELRPDGFVFFTNHSSDKGRQLAATGRASLTFGWLAMHRQVQVAGTAHRLADADADSYWAVRPREAQLAAVASDQSQPLSSRRDLLAAYDRADAAHPEVVPRPETWGGWLITPHTVEFWQGRQGRLHDRLRYIESESGWELGRLNP
ncbi:MAG: pyridoxamine 5'-phosphate oxidase [Acidimicrobiales bacterium]